MAMAAARLFLRTATASRNPVFRLMSARTQATSTTPAPASGSAADMVFTFASPSEVKLFYSKTTLPFLYPGFFQSSQKCSTD